MAKKKKKLPSYLIIVALAIIIGAYFALGNSRLFKSNKDLAQEPLDSSSAASKEVSALQKEAPSGSITFLNNSAVNYLDLSSQKKGDYKSSLQSANNNISADGSFIALDKKNNLIIWRKDKSIKTIVNNSSFNPLPAISPDKDHMLVINFSNAERDFGYKLELWNTSNRKIKDLNQTEKIIVMPKWTDKNNICYGINNVSGFEIIGQNTSNGNTHQIYKSDSGTIRYLSCKENTTAYATDDQINLINKSGNVNLQISDTNNLKGIELSPDSNALIFINKNSKLIYYNITSKNQQEVGSADYLIGWLN